MKKLIVLFAFIVCALPGFCAADGFTITGKITGLKAARVYLIVTNGNQRDTIATAPVVDEAFVLKGKVEKLQMAHIGFEGQKFTLRIYLENEVYSISAEGGFAVTGGGETQGVAARFNDIQRDLSVIISGLNKEFSTARSENNTKRMEEIQAEYKDHLVRMRERERELIVAHPNSLASLDNVVTFARQADYEALRDCFNLLSDEMKNTDDGKAIAARLAGLERVSVGMIAPDFELDTPDGGKITLHGVKAKVKLIDFWASWCGPCRGENPNVVAMYNDYHPKGLEIIGVSLDKDKEAWIKAIADDGLTWKHGSDLQFWQAAPAKLYMVNAIPHTVLLDENNRIIAKNLRGAALREKIAELLD
jgi:thiol-disulfide isomerase/thioredoxin